MNRPSVTTTLKSEVYAITNYKFQNDSLLYEVFTPPYLKERNITAPCTYERLEFLGDSVLNLIVSIILFEMYPFEKEGDLTLRKNDLVSGRKLIEISRSFNLMRLVQECPGKVMRRESDTLEALIGAIFLDGGFETAKQFVSRYWKKLARLLPVAPVDPKSKLYMWAQKRHLPPPIYRMINKTDLELNYTLTLQLKDTHGLGIVKVTTDLKKRGEINAARAMLARIENREKWKLLFNSGGDYISEEDLVMSSEDIKRRLYLWCKAHEMPSPQYRTAEGKTGDDKILYTTLVALGSGKGAYGVSADADISKKKAALKMLLRLCDEEREQTMFNGRSTYCEIDLCLPRNFKSLVDEWVTKNHLGEVVYTREELVSMGRFNVSLTIPKSGLGTVCCRAHRRREAEHLAAALMIERVVTQFNNSQRDPQDRGSPGQGEDDTNYKILLHSWTHKRHLPNPVYTVENVTGLGHSLLFTVSATVLGHNKTYASAYGKRLAQQKAASLMMKRINCEK